MTIAIRDLRTTINEFDVSDNNLDGSTGNNGTRDVVTVDPAPIEGTASIGIQISDTDPETIVAQGSFTNLNVSNNLIYGWFQVPNIAAIDATDPGLALSVGDGTNIQAYGVAGDNKAGFRHDQNFTDWNCVVLDTTLAENNGTTVTYNTTTNTQLTAGITESTIAQPDFTSADRIGYFCNRVVPIRGNVANSFFDIIRLGTQGLELVADSAQAIFGGTLGNQQSTFLDIAVDDRSGADQAGYGICRQVGNNQFILQGALTFGDSANGSVGLDFRATNATVFYQDIPTATVGTTSTGGGRVNVPRMRFISSAPTGATTPATTAIRLGNRTGDGTGNQGCTFIASLEADVDFSNENVDSVGIYGSVFRDFLNVKFRQDLTAGAGNHEVFQTDFIGCGRVDVGGIEFKANSIFNSIATGADSAAIHIKQTDNLSDLFISSAGTGHAISIDSATLNQSFTFSNFTYSGYASTTGNTGNEVLINNSGQPITVVVSGGDTPTIDSDGVRGKVTVVNNITVAITGILGATEVKVLPTAGSPYSNNTLNDTLNIATERVSADILQGDGTNYVSYTNNNGKVRINAIGTLSFDEVLTNGDTITTSPNGTALDSGDTVCVFIRDDDDNPTLQIADEFVVATNGTGQAAPSGSTIDTNTDFSTFTSVFGTPLTGSNSKLVSVERKDARYEFSVQDGTEIDFLAFRIGSDPVLTRGQTISSNNNTFPISQVGDRNYRNPA
jgi:hypothetical protein